MAAAQQLQTRTADWVTIDDLNRDPFPIYERLRAEGGVHFVKATGLYLVTSYDAVHQTELDRETFSANETGSLMIRAMGHSMLRRDDPEHYPERRAWQPTLTPGAVRRNWMSVFQRNAEKFLAEFEARGPGADLTRDFAAPYAAENLREMLGLRNVTHQDMQRWSQTLIDATGNYADDPVVWAAGNASYDEVDVAVDEMLKWHRTNQDGSLISTLLRIPDYEMPIESIRANIKMTIGGGLNEPRDVIGIASWALLSQPGQQPPASRDGDYWDSVFDEALRWVAPIGLYSRQTTRDTRLGGVDIPKGARVGICLLSANRDESKWEDPHVFDVRRTGGVPHLAFGKGIHVCLGAWAARAAVAGVALPLLFDRLPGLSLIEEQPARASGWVFRGMTSLAVTWDAVSAGSRPAGVPGGESTTVPTQPSIAIVGSGPAGCYSAGALRKTFANSEITVFEKLPVPFGLVRYGVAGDHLGTKAVTTQFGRLFEQQRIGFVGNTAIGRELSLAQLRAAYDVVVVATGLSTDRELEIPGGHIAGVSGAGRITRLLNSHPLEPRPAPSLGTDVAIVGHGNVAMDLVRLLAKNPAALGSNDVDLDSHFALTAAITDIHLIGRSLPELAKFDPSLVRELAELLDVSHSVHGIDPRALADCTDARSRSIHELATRPDQPDARIRLHWWFGASPVKILGSERVTGIEIRVADTTEPGRLEATSVITAIGFVPADQRLCVHTAETQTTGRVEPGLYVAGWARSGSRGAIPAQRSDAIALAKVISDDFLLAGSTRAGGATELLTSRATLATGYRGWKKIDDFERAGASALRPRAKLTQLRQLVELAASATESVEATGRSSADSPAPGARSTDLLTVIYATESGNAQMVAEDLAEQLSAQYEIRMMDLADLEARDIESSSLHFFVCSTYGDGELPTSARPFHTALLRTRPDLSRLRYAMFGMGDRSYPATYSRGSEILDEGLASLGGRRVGPYGRHDAGERLSAAREAGYWAREVLISLGHSEESCNMPSKSRTQPLDNGESHEIGSQVFRSIHTAPIQFRSPEQ